MIFRSPRHPWSGVHLDRTQLWPVLIAGWWTFEFPPGTMRARLTELLRELRKR